MWEVVQGSFPSISATTSAGWSAVAALFAALATLLTFLVQRRDLLESVRPELVLLHWGRGTTATPVPRDFLQPHHVKNVGRGTAFHVRIYTLNRRGGKVIAVQTETQIPIVAVNEEVPLSEPVNLFFANVPEERTGKTLDVTVHAVCSDSRGTEYDAQYRLFVLEPPRTFLNKDELTQGVRHQRIVVVRGAWRSKLRSRIGRIWHGVVRTAVGLRLKMKR